MPAVEFRGGEVDAKLTSGEVLSQTFRTFFSNLAVFGTICVLVFSPQILIQIATGFGQSFSEQPSASDFLLVMISMLLAIVLTPVATAALIHGVFQQIRGKEITIGACLAVGLRRLLPVLIVSVVVGVLVFLGILVCVVPGIYAAVVLAVAVPVTVVERPGLGGAIRRSEDLTKGYRWTVFGVIFAIGLMQVVVNLLVGFLGEVSMALVMLVGIPSAIVFPGLHATASALLYYHLRRVKESIDVDEIAAVFA